MKHLFYGLCVAALVQHCTPSQLGYSEVPNQISQTIDSNKVYKVSLYDQSENAIVQVKENEIGVDSFCMLLNAMSRAAYFEFPKDYILSKNLAKSEVIFINNKSTKSNIVKLKSSRSNQSYSLTFKSLTFSMPHVLNLFSHRLLYDPISNRDVYGLAKLLVTVDLLYNYKKKEIKDYNRPIDEYLAKIPKRLNLELPKKVEVSAKNDVSSNTSSNSSQVPAQIPKDQVDGDSNNSMRGSALNLQPVYSQDPIHIPNHNGSSGTETTSSSSTPESEKKKDSNESIEGFFGFVKRDGTIELSVDASAIVTKTSKFLSHLSSTDVYNISAAVLKVIELNNKSTNRVLYFANKILTSDEVKALWGTYSAPSHGILALWQSALVGGTISFEPMAAAPFEPEWDRELPQSIKTSLAAIITRRKPPSNQQPAHQPPQTSYETLGHFIMSASSVSVAVLACLGAFYGSQQLLRLMSKYHALQSEI